MKFQTTKRISIWVTALVLGFATTLSAQQAVTIEGYGVDFFGRPQQDLSELPKMERDIVILKNVLNELFTEGDSYIYRRGGVNGIYVPGRGVIFNISALNRFGGTYFAGDAAVIALDSDKAKDKEGIDADNLNQEREASLKKSSLEFLLNYGSLLSELKPNERIMLNVDYTEMHNLEKIKKSGQGVIYARAVSRNAGKKRMSSSINYSDIEAFMDGDINQSAAEAKVDQKITDLDEENVPDAKIMAGILDDLFQTTLNGKLKRRGNTSFSYFDGFGIMFDMKMGSSARSSTVFIESAQLSVLRKSDKDDDTDKELEEFYKALEDGYPEFEALVKESILEYGRTLRSVKANEVVVVNIDLGTSFRKTKLPRSIQLMVPKSTITAYAKGNKSLEDAKSEIDIKKLTSSISTNSSFGTTMEFVAPADAAFPKKKAYGTATKVKGFGQQN